MREKIYAVMGVDVETDVGSFTPFYEGVKNGTPLLLDLFDRHDMKATFYVVANTAKDNPDSIRSIAARGHDVGCHSLAHETVGDALFPLPGVEPLLPHEVGPRLEMATEIVEEVAGQRPVSFRSPRLWGSTTVVQTLADLGYTSDASYPMYFYREQFAPYFTDPQDWTKSGDGPILEIPNFADMAMESSDPGLERDRDQWPIFRTEGAEALLGRVRAFLDWCDANDHPKFLCFYIHPWEFWPMAESYNFGEATVTPDAFITKNCGKVALRELDALLTGLEAMGVEFVMAKELPDLVRNGEVK